ncbi:MAG: InlB B-repeat-containing protein [Alphaproteobacteria bacterium]|nr:InlB B-repeat-containing protein [Alphaproteobacteria bacterium]
MGRFSRFLRFCAILVVSFFTVNAFGAGYTCPTLKKYTSCNPGYYLSGTGVENSCKQCEQGYYCTGGTNARTLCTAGKACTTTGLSAPNATCTAGYYCPAGSTSATQSKCPTNWTSAAGAGAQTKCYRDVKLYKTANGITATGVLSMTNPVTSTTVSSTGTTALTTQCYYNTACTFPTVTQASSSSTTTQNALYHPYVNFTGGWGSSSTNVSGGTTKTFYIISTSSSVSYYPAHTSKAVTITLNSSGATSSGTTAIYSKYGSGVYLDSALANKMSGTENPITVPTRAGYVFTGYYTGARGGTLIIKPTGYYADASTTRFTQPTTLYAQWEACTAGYYCPAGSTSVTQNQCPTNWTSAAGAGAQTDCYRDVTLNAYGAYEATLTWTDGCGNPKTWTPSSSANTITQCCKYNTVCSMPSPATLTPASGYKIFDGWYTTYTLPNSGVSLTLSPRVTSTAATATYYPARRKINTLTLNNQSATTAGTTAIYSVYADGVYLDSMALNKKMTISSVTLGANPITLPTKTGYTFGGYYTSTACSGTQRIDADGRIASTFYTAYTADATLYACWVAKTYTVTLDANGGSGHLPTSVTATYFQPMPELTRLPTRAGYVFDGWWYNGSMYYDASGNSFLNWNVDADVTLTARWKECTAGYYCPAGSTSVTQNQCPTNWTSDAATGSENACYRTCVAGTLWNPGTGACEPSPQGYICPNSKKVTYGSRTTLTWASQLQSCGLCRNVRSYPYVLSDVGNTSQNGCYAGFILNKNGGNGDILVRDMLLNTSTRYNGTDNGVLKCYSQLDCVLPSQNLTQTGYTFPHKWCFTENCDWGPVISDEAKVTTSTLIYYVENYNNHFTPYPQRVIGLDGTIGRDSDVTIGYIGELFASKLSKCDAGTYLPARSTTCEACSAGYYCPIDGTYSFSDSIQGREPCLPGEYQPDTGKTSCLKAAKGYFTQGPANTTQTPCAELTYQDETGQANCKSCPTPSNSTFTSKYSWSSDGVYDALHTCWARGTVTNDTGTIKLACGASDYASGTYEYGCRTDNGTVCAPGYYFAGNAELGSFANVVDGSCGPVGEGKYFAGGQIKNFRTAQVPEQCPPNLTTIGYGTGANEAEDCGRKLHAGGNVIYLRSAQRTTPSLRVRVGDDVFFGSLSETIEGALKVNNGTEYSVVNDWQ